MAVADDGSGDHRDLQRQLFNRDRAGLSAVAERVRSLSGVAWFERRRGGGVKLLVEVPVRPIDRVSRGEAGLDGHAPKIVEPRRLVNT